MHKEKINFENKNKQTLKAFLYTPFSRKYAQIALFAHCFTCSKNLKTVQQIAQGLTDFNIAVLAFDFTGLGESEGDFSETTFSHNIADLLEANSFLAEKYQAPTLLIGHSLGGTAAIYAASQLKNIKAVVSIGSPFEPKHVTHLFDNKSSKIEVDGQAEVNIGGRNFLIKKEFLEDLEKRSEENILPSLGKALLVMHSPQDEIVDIKNAEKIYTAAKHPKSFIGLEGADHLMREDNVATYVGKVIANWCSPFLPDNEVNSDNIEANRQENEVVHANLYASDKFTTSIHFGEHSLIADEPASLGGKNLGASPYQLLKASLASCSVMTIQLYAKRKAWNLEKVSVSVSHKKIKNSEIEKDHFTRNFQFEGDLTNEQQQRLLEIAKKCPIHKTLHNEIIVEDFVEEI